MTTAIKGGKVYRNGSFEANDIFIVDQKAESGHVVNTGSDLNSERVISIDNSFILPSFCDVHVHFREPGQSYKETIRTGCQAAVHGGYTTVCTMPNLKPAPSTPETLGVQLDMIRKDANIHVIPYGTITMDQNGRGQLSDMEGMKDLVCAFSDDGRGVQADALMEEAMLRAKSLGKMIVAHCEDEDLLRQGRVPESEWRQIERDLELAAKTGAAYHVCHISCKESVEAIRQAKKSGVDVTCETAPHYLLFNTDDLNKFIAADPAHGGRFKMNPPIKDRAAQEAMIEGVLDGTVDMIATDHAPHSEEEKSRGFEKSPNGITGLECAFPTLYTGLVREGIMPLEKLVEIMSINPRKRFGIQENNSWTVVDFSEPWTIDSSKFYSMGKYTPFEGMQVYGKIKMTICDGEIVYEEGVN